MSPGSSHTEPEACICGAPIPARWDGCGECGPTAPQVPQEKMQMRMSANTRWLLRRLCEADTLTRDWVMGEGEHMMQAALSLTGFKLALWKTDSSGRNLTVTGAGVRMNDFLEQKKDLTQV